MLIRFIAKYAVTSKLPFYVRNSLRHYHKEKISTIFSKTHFRKFSSINYDENEPEIDESHEQFDQLIQRHLPAVNLDDPVMVN
jgi:dolichyl-phosphate-mannose--protein O-mannosyl transferase